jgi:hypothetical protein
MKATLSGAIAGLIAIEIVATGTATATEIVIVDLASSFAFGKDKDPSTESGQSLFRGRRPWRGKAGMPHRTQHVTFGDDAGNRRKGSTTVTIDVDGRFAIDPELSGLFRCPSIKTRNNLYVMPDHDNSLHAQRRQARRQSLMANHQHPPRPYILKHPITGTMVRWLSCTTGTCAKLSDRRQGRPRCKGSGIRASSSRPTLSSAASGGGGRGQWLASLPSSASK